MSGTTASNRETSILPITMALLINIGICRSSAVIQRSISYLFLKNVPYFTKGFVWKQSKVTAELLIVSLPS